MEMIELDRLSLSQLRAAGRVPKDSPELRRRIQANGIVDPVVVRPRASDPGRYEVLSNPETCVAAGKLGIQRVPVVVRDDIDDDQAFSIIKSQYDSLARDPITEAEWYQEQLDELTERDAKNSQTIARLARVTGKNRSHVSRALALLKLPLEVQVLFREGKLSAAHGRFLTKLKGPTEQIRLAKKAVVEKLKVRDLEAIVNKPQRAATVAPIKKDPDTLRLEREVTRLVGSPVSIDLAAGTLTIDYFKNFETLDGILERLGYRRSD